MDTQEHVSVNIFRVYLNDVMLEMNYTTASKNTQFLVFILSFSIATLHPNFFIYSKTSIIRTSIFRNVD